MLRSLLRCEPEDFLDLPGIGNKLLAGKARVPSVKRQGPIRKLIRPETRYGVDVHPEFLSHLTANRLCLCLSRLKRAPRKRDRKGGAHASAAPD